MSGPGILCGGWIFVKKIGVLAHQGDFDAHRHRLEELGAEVVLVKKPEQLDEIDGLVIPGGESGTFLKLLGEAGFEKLKQFVHVKPTFGTCAGAILLANEVENPQQSGLGALDMRIRRNAYGRQIDSSTPAKADLGDDAAGNGLHSRPQNRAHRPRSRSTRHRRRRSGRCSAGKSNGRDIPPRTERRHPRASGIP